MMDRVELNPPEHSLVRLRWRDKADSLYGKILQTVQVQQVT